MLGIPTTTNVQGLHIQQRRSSSDSGEEGGSDKELVAVAVVAELVHDLAEFPVRVGVVEGEAPLADEVEGPLEPT